MKDTKIKLNDKSVKTVKDELLTMENNLNLRGVTTIVKPLIYQSSVLQDLETSVHHIPSIEWVNKRLATLAIPIVNDDEALEGLYVWSSYQTDAAISAAVAGLASASHTHTGYQATITGGATTITTSNLTVSRALVSDASGKVAVSTVTSTQLGYLSGVTSAIQTQLNGKQATLTGGATTIASTNLTASRALVSDASGKVAVSGITATELGFVSGVTSAVQTQLDAKKTTITGGKYYTGKVGGATDLEWKSLFRMTGADRSGNGTATSASNYYEAGTVIGKVYDRQGNHNQEIINGYQFQFTMQSWGGQQRRDTAKLFIPTGMPDILRVVKYGINDYELQIRSYFNYYDISFELEEIGNMSLVQYAYRSLLPYNGSDPVVANNQTFSKIGDANSFSDLRNKPTTLAGYGITDAATAITGGASTIATSNLTTSRALVSDGNGKVAAASTTSTELGYLSGVTSAIQTQLNGKAASTHTHTELTNLSNRITPGSNNISITGTGTGVGAMSYIDFKDGGGTRKGYIGKGSTTDNDIIIASDSGAVRLLGSGLNLLKSDLTSSAFWVDNTGNVTTQGNISAPNGSLVAVALQTTSNNLGQNIKVGDDAWIGDISLANGIGIRGVNDSTKGYIVFGSSNNVALGRSGTGALTYGGDFTASGNITANSDIRLKTNIRPYENGIEKVMRLRPVVYDRTDIESDDEVGFIANEVQEIEPQLVKANTDEDCTLSLDYSRVVVILTKAMQEQQMQIEEQQMQIEELKSEIAKLKGGN